MKQAIQEELKKEHLTDFHRTLRDKAVNLVNMSRSMMSKHYSKWDKLYDIYSAYKCMSQEDRRKLEKGEPKSMRLPITYANVETFKTFCLTAFTQRAKFYELEGVGEEDQAAAACLEDALNIDVQRNNLQQLVAEMLVNVGVFGIGVLKHTFETETCHYPYENEEGGRVVDGARIGAKKVLRYQSVTKTEGNTVRNLTPYRFFPDPRLSVADFQRGEFCASELELTKIELQKMEGEGKVYGTKYIQHFPESAIGKRAQFDTRLNSIRPDDRDTTRNSTCITEVQMKLIPAETKLSNGVPIGEETFPVVYILWIANDQRVIRCEPMAYLHGQFTYDVSLYGRSTHEFIPQGLAEMTEPLQETIDWFVESRVSAVTRTIDNQLIVDPLGVNMDSLKTRQRVITLKKGAARTGVDRYIKQLQVQDTTQGHMGDVTNFIEIARMTTGVNENALGQYHKGRRSATEARVVSRGAAARQLAIADSIWSTCLGPLGSKMLINLRQGMSEDYFKRTLGKTHGDQWKAFKATPAELVTNVDYFIFDGTMPSEKEYLAQTLQELLGLVMNNPEAQAQFDMSPRLILNKIFELRGVKMLADFSMSKDQNGLQALLQQAFQQGAMAMQQQLAQQTPPPQDGA